MAQPQPNEECTYRDIGTESDWEARVIGVQPRLLGRGKPVLIIHVLPPGAKPVELSSVPWSDKPRVGHAFPRSSDGVEKEAKRKRG